MIPSHRIAARIRAQARPMARSAPGDRGAAAFFMHIEVDHKINIIVDGNDHGEHAEHRQDDEVGLENRPEEHQFPHEAGGGGQPRQRDEAEGQEAARQGCV